MRIDVELHRSDLAEVTHTPSLLARILFGAKPRTFTVSRYLAIRGGFLWLEDHTGAAVDQPTQDAIEREVRAARRRRSFAAVADEPPG